MRVHELAKELGLENKALIELCLSVGLEGKRSHSSSLSDDDADKIRRFVIRSAVSQREGLVREVTREGQRLTEMRKGSVIRRRKKTPEEEAAEEQQEESTTAGTISLEEAARQTTRVIPSLQPDLAQERRDRDEALRNADALFEEAEDKEDVKKDESAEAEIVEKSISKPRVIGKIKISKKSEVEIKTVQKDVQEQIDQSIAAEQEEKKEQVSSALESAEEEIELDKETEQDQAERLAEIRKRHDIKAPKVLGKISLPVKVEIAKKASTGTDGAEYEEKESEKGHGPKSLKGKKKKTYSHADTSDDLELERKKPKKKQVLRKDELLDYDGEREVWRAKKEKKSKQLKESKAEGDLQAQQQTKKLIKIDGQISVGELAKQMGVKAGETIAQLMKLGIMATINQLIDYDTASLIAEEAGHKTQNVEMDLEGLVASLHAPQQEELNQLRPPVVTVMGHVDHGKTSLLDAIRKTSVTTNEVGGITQHIGAYNVRLSAGGSVTFLDTPGHEAFTAMRGRGAKVTDIVVLVVAADDGVMPQTIEAINHAKAAGVSIVVAINKIDKHNANVDKVISQLAEFGLVPEEWGGDTLMVKVSAHTKEGIDKLLESLNLQSEILELKANPNRAAVGTVIESKLDRGRGPVLTVLVQNGTLRKGDSFVAGSVAGKIRALIGSDGETLQEAGPSIPVEILGADSSAMSGDDFLVLENEAKAREIADERLARHRRKELAMQSAQAAKVGPLTLERFSVMVNESQELKELPLIIKADVQGSVEALAASLQQLSNEEVKIKILHKGVGAITENDVQLAAASNAVVVAYNVRPDSRATTLIDSEGVDLLYSRVIYDLVDSVNVALKGRMATRYQEKTLGRVEVRQTFKVPKQGVIAGSYVLDGTVERNALVRLLRDGIVIHEGKLSSLRRFKDDVKEVQAGYECGIGLEGYGDIKNGDVLEVYKVEAINPQ